MTISPSYPNILTNGTPADATQVMADFFQIQNDVNANAAHNGANSDITSLTGLTTPLGIIYGGTGQPTASAALTALGGAPSASPTFTGLITGVNETLTGNLIVDGTTSLVGNAQASGTLTVGNNLIATSAMLLSGILSGATSSAAALGVTPPVNDATTKLATTKFANPDVNLATSGHVELPSGFIINWGTTGNLAPGATTSPTFDKAFGTACLGVVYGNNGDVQTFSITTTTKNTTGFTVKNPSASPSSPAIFWIAIGY